MKFDIFKNLRKEHQILFGVLVFILLVAIFIPRQTPLFSIEVGASVGNLKGVVGVEAFEEFSASELPEGKEDLDKASSNKSFVMYYAPWCGWSKKAMPQFAKLANDNNTGVHIAAVNCDVHKDLATKHNVEGFPSFKFHPNGTNSPGEDYTGERDASSIMDFLRNK
tara:strand:+ start:9720 stop:10217 length:498 start_codon:yes stop_codon:yes gene_type:complete